MRDVEDAHEPVLQVQAQRYQCIDAPGDQPAGQQLQPGRKGHGLLPDRFVRVEFGCGQLGRPDHLELTVLPLADGAGRGGVFAAGELDITDDGLVTRVGDVVADGLAVQARLLDGIGEDLQTRPAVAADGSSIFLWCGDAGYETGNPDLPGPRNRLLLPEGFGGPVFEYIRSA